MSSAYSPPRYATLHDYKTWWSTELVSAWDLEAAWNKIPLLYVLMHPESPVSQGAPQE